MSTTMKRIDVHHHILPPTYLSMLASIGITESLGIPFPEWRPEKALTTMRKMNVSRAITSISSPGVHFKDAAFTRELARACTEYMAEVKRDYPDKFGGFAPLPLPDVNGAVAELKYALDDLQLDGIGLMSHYDGKYLGHEDFEEVFFELNRRKAVVFIHPTDPSAAYDPALGMPNSLIEAPFETTRAVANLMYTGTTDRYPNIRYILAHGGGTIPYLAWRVALIQYAQKGKKTPVVKTLWDFMTRGEAVDGLKILKSMYYDCAYTTSPYALKALQEFAGASHIVFGSDYPFAKLAPIVAKNLRKYTSFSEDEFEAIDHRNCLELFPEIKLANR